MYFVYEDLTLLNVSPLYYSHMSARRLLYPAYAEPLSHEAPNHTRRPRARCSLLPVCIAPRLGTYSLVPRAQCAVDSTGHAVARWVRIYPSLGGPGRQ